MPVGGQTEMGGASSGYSAGEVCTSVTRCDVVADMLTSANELGTRCGPRGGVDAKYVIMGEGKSGLLGECAWMSGS